MSGETAVTLHMSAETLSAIATIAARRGMSTERFAGDVLRRVAEEEAVLAADIAEGRGQIAAGDYLTHEELVADIERWKREQRRVA